MNGYDWILEKIDAARDAFRTLGLTEPAEMLFQCRRAICELMNLVEQQREEILRLQPRPVTGSPQMPEEGVTAPPAADDCGSDADGLFGGDARTGFEPPQPSTPSITVPPVAQGASDHKPALQPLTFAVGKRYRTRAGAIVKIVSIDPGLNYPITGDNGATYTAAGTEWESSLSGTDLVEEVAEEPAALVAEAEAEAEAEADPEEEPEAPLLNGAAAVEFLRKEAAPELAELAEKLASGKADNEERTMGAAYRRLLDVHDAAMRALPLLQVLEYTVSAAGNHEEAKLLRDLNAALEAEQEVPPAPAPADVMDPSDTEGGTHD